MTISLLHPSRGRAYKSFETISKWLRCAGSNVELVVSIDTDDEQKDEYIKLYGEAVIINDNKSSVEAVNKAAQASTGDLMIVVSDDTDCFEGWANMILSAVSDKKDFVLKVNDGIQKWIITMPILDRVYYDRFGYIYHPDYKHMFCDTQFTHVADILKKVIWRNDISFPHNHYSTRRSQRDAISERADATINHGKEVYLRNFKNCFGLNGIDPWDLHQLGEDNKQWLIRNLR